MIWFRFFLDRVRWFSRNLFINETFLDELWIAVKEGWFLNEPKKRPINKVEIELGNGINWIQKSQKWCRTRKSPEMVCKTGLRVQRVDLKSLSEWKIFEIALKIQSHSFYCSWFLLPASRTRKSPRPLDRSRQRPKKAKALLKISNPGARKGIPL